MNESFAQIRMNNVGANLFVNMNGTAVYFNTHHNYTVYEKGENCISAAWKQ